MAYKKNGRRYTSYKDDKQYSEVEGDFNDKELEC